MSGGAIELRTIAGNGIEMNVAVAGDGPPLLLLHGWPHTWQVWSAVLPELARTHRVIAPDLRGMGATTRAVDGYDAANLAADALALLDVLDVARADVMAIDAGVPAAFMLAMTEPARVRRLVLMESLLGRLPGAEQFLAGGAPWWFGFHTVPGLAERVLTGHEDAYLDWFYSAGTHDGRGIDPTVRAEFVRAYGGSEALRGGFEHYRAKERTDGQIASAVARARLGTPTLAIGAQPVNDVLHRQLQPIADDLTGAVLEQCGHLVPLDRPAELLALVEPFLA
jgi:pimeloyl-ACP methyl ester carboxylesterase